MGMDNVFDDFRRNTKCLINVPNKNVIRKSIFMVEFHTSSLLLLSRISHLPLTFFFSFHACVNKDYGAGGGEEVDEKKRGRKRVSISREERGGRVNKKVRLQKKRDRFPPHP